MSETLKELILKSKIEDMFQFGTILLSIFACLSISANTKLDFSDINRANPEDCTEVRLDQKPGLMADIPIQDQGATGFCWSYAGTQLIDAWRSKYPPPNTPPWTSPDAAAFEFMALKGLSDPNASVSMFNFLESASILKSCDYSTFNQKRFASKNDSELFKRIEALHRLARSSSNDANIELMFKECFAGFRPEDKNVVNISNIRKHALENDWVGFTKNILRDYCGNNNQNMARVPKPEDSSPYTYASEHRGDGARGVRAVQKAINNHLNKFDKLKNPKVLPIGVQLCPEVLNRPMGPTLNRDGRIDKSACKTQAGTQHPMHAMIIVGRRPAVWTNPKNPSEKVPICQYLLRNSYGTSCNGYPPSDVFTPKDRCAVNDGKETGQIWVDELSLLGNTDVTYFMPDRPN